MIASTILKGGLGNNLFQISNLLSYSMKHNIDYYIPTVIENPHSENQKVFYSPKLKYSNGNGAITATVYKEPHFRYAEIPAPTSQYTILDGYWQSYRYMEPYKDEIIKLLDIGCDYKKDTIFLHLRLDDYKHLTQHHQIISDDYIEGAIAYFHIFLGYTKFKIFSDEIEEAKKRIDKFWQIGLIFEYVEGQTDIEDLRSMASCEGGILSASSFSWWGAYLGQNEKRPIVYPAMWFPNGVGHSIKDLCPLNWLAL